MRHGSAAEIAMRLSLYSDHFLEAARCLPSTNEQMALPRKRLLALALEYRLKAFICAVRRGNPQSTDLSRLANLASNCGLVLTVEQFDGIALLSRTHAGNTENCNTPDLEWATLICDAIAAQASQPDG